MRFSGGVVIVAALAGCLSMMAPQLGVGPAIPRPNIMIAPDKTPGALVLDPGIADNFVIAETGSVREVPVRAWRHTLETGFHNAFAPAADARRLEILEAQLAFSPAAVGRGGTAAVVATIRFKARVIDGSGAQLSAVAGTVEAREATVTPNEASMTDNAAKAVEALYERLTADLLAKI